MRESNIKVYVMNTVGLVLLLLHPSRYMSFKLPLLLVLVD
jgi:hypothetical protein